MAETLASVAFQGRAAGYAGMLRVSVPTTVFGAPNGNRTREVRVAGDTFTADTATVTQQGEDTKVDSGARERERETMLIREENEKGIVFNYNLYSI